MTCLYLFVILRPSCVMYSIVIYVSQISCFLLDNLCLSLLLLTPMPFEELDFYLFEVLQSLRSKLNLTSKLSNEQLVHALSEKWKLTILFIGISFIHFSYCICALSSLLFFLPHMQILMFLIFAHTCISFKGESMIYIILNEEAIFGKTYFIQKADRFDQKLICTILLFLKALSCSLQYMYIRLTSRYMLQLILKI